MREERPDAKIRALIVDDEPPARSVIRKMLAEDAEVEVIGECSNGEDAIPFIEKHAPDLLFLDIQMPEMDGFALLESLAEEKAPAVIFVTAYNRYAVRAFDVAAVDYLLKPFDHERMATAVERAKTNLREKSAEDRNRQMLDLLRQLSARQQTLDRFVIKQNGRVLLIPTEEVDWIEAAGNYVTLYSGDRKYLIRETMKRVELRLDPQKFIRIHRSTIVNVERVRELQIHFNEEHLVILKDGRELVLSRRYREKLSQKLGTSI
ncbi:MAG: LytTR family DNA-binding domain-containing protein [Pyrinomonadaceae bacterium]